jgi:hypothetical protein
LIIVVEKRLSTVLNVVTLRMTSYFLYVDPYLKTVIMILIAFTSIYMYIMLIVSFNSIINLLNDYLMNFLYYLLCPSERTDSVSSAVDKQPSNRH